MRTAAFAGIRLVISSGLAKDGGWASDLEYGPETENDYRT